METKNKTFWVLVGKELSLYIDRNKAVANLKNALQKNPKATVAEIIYKEKSGKKSEKEGAGTFEVEQISWQDIALELLGVSKTEDNKDNDKTEDKNKNV